MSSDPVWSSDNTKLKELLRDMGFDTWSYVPEWILDLAVDLIDAGWKKKK